jgi:hypothetical protein
MTYSVLILGGEGPAAWDTMRELDGYDFLDAARRASDLAKELGGWVHAMTQIG